MCYHTLFVFHCLTSCRLIVSRSTFSPMFPASLQPQSKVRKPRSKTKSKIDLFKKCIEEKIQLFKEQAPEDLLEKVSASAHRSGLAGGRTEPWGAVAAHLNPAPSFYTVPLGGLPIPSPLPPWGAGGVSHQLVLLASPPMLPLQPMVAAILCQALCRGAHTEGCIVLLHVYPPPIYLACPPLPCAP